MPVLCNFDMNGMHLGKNERSQPISYACWASAHFSN